MRPLFFPNQRDEAGFTLMEVAVVLVIVALLLGGMWLPLAAQQDLRQIAETQRLLMEARDALIGYAAMAQPRPHLPCPDTDGDGVENRLGSGCQEAEGDLPWVDLGVGREDSWGSRLRYRASSAFTDASTGISLMASGDLTLCADADCNQKIADKLVAVVFSRGKNKAAEEKNNDPKDKLFVSRPAGGDFDDLVAWLPSPLLFHRLIGAGRLP